MTEVTRGANAEDAGQSAVVGVPLCVDLDGTLLRTDTLLEAALVLLHRSLWRGLQLLAWLFRGRAGFKAEVARRVELDVQYLPVNAEFLDWLRAQKAQGRRLVLFSGGPRGDPDIILNEAIAIRNAGAAGQMIGRNAFQRSREEALDLFEKLIRVYRGAD